MNTNGVKAQPKTQNPTIPTKLPTTNHPARAPPPALRRRVPPLYRLETRRKCCTCRCCCMTLFWTALIAIALLAAAAMAAAGFYAYYRPRPPSFAVSSLDFTHLNLTATNTTSAAEAAAKMNLSITVRNPNAKITFVYPSINVTVVAQRGKIIMGSGSFPQFIQSGKNTTELFAQIESGEDFDDKALKTVKSDLKNKKGLDLKVEMETQMRLKVGERIKTGEFGLRVSCSRITAFASSNRNLTESAVQTSVDAAKCDVHFIVTIFEWEISFSTKT